MGIKYTKGKITNPSPIASKTWNEKEVHGDGFTDK
jgi:hypothetical protein